MTIQKIFVISLATMLFALYAMYTNIQQPNISVNTSIVLSDDILIGIALFTTYLLLARLYPKKASRRLIK